MHNHLPRVGVGYDAHRLQAGRPLILGGVHIPYTHGLLGHSDADVLTHTIMDAILGALALGSIGDFFPDTDPQYKGADSILLLRDIMRVITEKGYRVHNVDAVIVAQLPKLSPHIPEIRAHLAPELQIPVDHLGIKATTTEKMGPEGRQEGMSCHAVVLLYRAND
jgi:2-C-methyl-D-erythritol 2,4-cyclodiphosphate synthase